MKPRPRATLGSEMLSPDWLWPAAPAATQPSRRSRRSRGRGRNTASCHGITGIAALQLVFLILCWFKIFTIIVVSLFLWSSMLNFLCWNLVSIILFRYWFSIYTQTISIHLQTFSHLHIFVARKIMWWKALVNYNKWHVWHHARVSRWLNVRYWHLYSLFRQGECFSIIMNPNTASTIFSIGSTITLKSPIPSAQRWSNNTMEQKLPWSVERFMKMEKICDNWIGCGKRRP